MEKKQMILSYCRQFNMGGLTADFDRVLIEAENSAVSYIDYTLELFKAEAGHREKRNLERRLKVAGLPLSHDLSTYDYGFDNGLQKSRLSQLRELNWLDQIYNIIFMGPSGTGKTFLAAGLCFDAVHMGYKAYFRTMEQIIYSLYMRTLRAIYNKAISAGLVNGEGYPFKKYKIKTGNLSKRALSKDDIIKLTGYQAELNSSAWHSLNYFIFSYLTRGMNLKDMALLKWKENILGDRIVYVRAKTANTKKSLDPSIIKIEPEISKILDRYSDDNEYVFPILESGLSPTTVRYRIKKNQP